MSESITVRVFRRSINVPFGVLTLEATRDEYLCSDVIAGGTYSKTFSQRENTIRLGFDVLSDSPLRYRDQQLRKGVYLGHHRGPPALMSFYNGTLDLSLSNSHNLADYQKLLWTFGLKLVFTLEALRGNALHLKAVSLRGDFGVILLIGRGGSGKTTLARFLTHAGVLNLLGNTHAFVKDGHAWAVNTWRRVRRETGEQYDPAVTVPSDYLDGPLTNIIVVDSNQKGAWEFREMKPELAQHFMSFFAASVINYDLKEDLFDHVLADPFDVRLGLLGQENKMVTAVAHSVPIHYLSADVEAPYCRERIIQLFQEL